MKHVFRLVCVLAVVGLASKARAQSPQRIVGNRISGEMHLDPRNDTVTETATLTFQSGDRGPVYTIDFVEAVPLVTRLHSRRSVVATVSLAELDRITSAGAVVDRTFDTELELGAGQLQMLRATADRWLGRVR